MASSETVLLIDTSTDPTPGPIQGPAPPCSSATCRPSAVLDVLSSFEIESFSNINENGCDAKAEMPEKLASAMPETALQILPDSIIDGVSHGKERGGDDSLEKDSGGDEDGSETEDDAARRSDGRAYMMDVSQKKRADYDAFGTWLSQNQTRVVKQAKEALATASDDDDGKTSAALIGGLENKNIIESPRDYQVELFEKAKLKNIIAVLDTGSGKTLIAALLLRHTIDNELADRAQDKPPRVAFFLVDKVALVYQQYAVLQCNLGHPVAKFSGESRDSRWLSTEFWVTVLKDNMAIVCTADILLSCLHHSYIRMDQINLLVFDEAHHAKKNHPYARIIKDFYCHTSAESNRPKIFGMTASPIDARANVVRAAQELEALLQSEITTISNDSQLRSVVKPKEERVQFYHLAICPPPTELTRRIFGLVGSHRIFARNCQFAQVSLIQLGPWIVDRFWQIIFRPDELAKQEAMADRESLEQIRPASALVAEQVRPEADTQRESGDPAPAVNFSESVLAVREASRVVQQHLFCAPSTSQLSSKVQRLHEVLVDTFTKSTGESARCIVFVQQRYTAILLADLFKHEPMKVPNMRTGALVGGSSSDLGANSLRSQLLSISKFKRGQINCLFATSVAEEGLDIPDCNMVIRFDLYRTMIQYIQSRGRARHQDSVYIHMAEFGNLEHKRLLEENKSSEAKMREFCNALPDDRKISGNDLSMDFFLQEELDQYSYEVPSTKAKLTYRSSLEIITRYVSTLPETTDGDLRPQYSLFHTSNGYVCELSLPSSSPVRHATGRPHAKKQAAKCSAAFAMCLVLYQKKYLDTYLNPVFVSKLPAMRNARLAISSKKQERYRMRTKPETWTALGPPRQLYATVLRLGNPEALLRPSRPLVLLTRQPMPELAQIPLFFGKGRASHVECIPFAVPLSLTKDELNDLAAYTFRVFEDVFSKEYGGTAADLPYYLVPSVCSQHQDIRFASSSTSESRHVLDWASIRQVAQEEHINSVGDEPDEFFTEKFITDPFDGSRKFYMRRVRRDLTCLDPELESAPAPKNRGWKSLDHNILNYSVSLWSKSRASRNFRHDQPVVEADVVIQRRNLLDDRVDLDDPVPKKCYLVLETLKISALPVDVVAMVYNFPPVIHRLESALIALEATTLLGLQGISPSLALEALTKDCDGSDENEDTALINFQAGMGKNYERLELLGDSFLKMASTIALYTLVPDKDEFEYHVQRMCMICNRNLLNNALEMGLEEYIRSREFDRSWYPPVKEEATTKAEHAHDGAPTSAASAATTNAATVPADNGKVSPDNKKGSQFGLVLKKGKRQKTPSEHALGDKNIADVCEAFIGAAYLSTYREKDFDLAVRAVSAVVRSKLHPMQAYRDYFASYHQPEWQTAPVTAAQQHMAQSLARQTGYRFRYPRLLRCAFMHPSYPRIYENLPSYQRLEFLGDALFDMAAVDFLFHRFPDKDPQWLTEHKMAMVSNQFLSALCVSLGLHKHLLSFSAPLQKQVLDFVAKIDAARTQAEDEAEQQAGHPRGRSDFARDFWVHVARPPKALADVLEAYLGALFVDAGYDYHGAVLGFFRAHVQPYFEDMSLYDTFANKHPVTFAVNLLARRFGCRDWRVVVQEVPDNAGAGCVTFATQVAAGFLVHGRVVGHGLAESGRYAKIAAAKQALAKFDSLGVAAFQSLTGCHCQNEADSSADAASRGKAPAAVEEDSQGPQSTAI